MPQMELVDRSILESVEQLVEKEAFSEALKQIEQLDGCTLRDLSVLNKANIYFFSAHCMYKLGSYRRGLIKAKVASYLARKLQDDTLYARSKLLLGYIFRGLGRYSEALEEFNEAYVFGRRTKDFRGIILALSSIAQMHFVSGNLRQCIETLRISLNYTSKYLPKENASIDKQNLARVLLFTGEFREASRLFDECADEVDSELGKAHMSSLRGMLNVFLHDFEKAEGFLLDALDFFTGAGLKRDQGVCLEYLGLLEYFRGDYRKARIYYEQVLNLPEPTASAVAQTHRLLTDLLIAEGEIGQAYKTARKAEIAIKKVNERIELGALYRAYAQIYSHQGNKDAANIYFKKSIDLLNDLGARYELALTHLACGKSEASFQDERKQHLELARMLFTEFGVARLIEQADAAIAEMRELTPPIPTINRTGDGAPTVIARSRKMKTILRHAQNIAASDMNVLLTGETGTGKDLLALYMHHCSGRKGEFVDVNAAAIPNEMIESELFGHAKGAFTGATRDKPGLFEMAEDGTFYLNEVADASPDFQAKLLQVLETREIRRLGETRKRKLSFRLVAATNHDLDRRIAEDRFRLDLFHRIGDERIRLPALRERTDDIVVLVQHFLSLISSDCLGKADGYLTQLAKALTGRDWLGNVRELRSEVNRLWLASSGDFRRMIVLASPDADPCDSDSLRRTLEETGWNRRKAARRLGICEGTVRYRIKKYNLIES